MGPQLGPTFIQAPGENLGATPSSSPHNLSLYSPREASTPPFQAPLLTQGPFVLGAASPSPILASCQAKAGNMAPPPRVPSAPLPSIWVVPPSNREVCWNMRWKMGRGSEDGFNKSLGRLLWS